MPDNDISVAYPEADDLDLRIALGACRVEGRSSEEGSWIAGTYRDPTGKRAPIIRKDKEGRFVTITEEKPSFERIPAVFGSVPHYELEFGKYKERPIVLTIETGASEFDLDLGGVPLKALTIKQGPGRFNLNFSAPNPHPMSLLEISSGAAGMELENLANANFSRMRLSAGAASYEIDFGGRLSQPAEVVIEAGLSGVEIAVPGSTAAEIVAETTVGSVDVGDGFNEEEGCVLDGSRHGREEAALNDPCWGEAGSPSDQGDLIESQTGVRGNNDPNPADRIVPNAISRRPECLPRKE